MKIFNIIQEEMNRIHEDPDSVSFDGGYTNVSDSGAYPFAYNKNTDDVDIGSESDYHDGREIDLARPEHIYPGRIFTNDKILAFWTYPNEEEFKYIVSKLEDKLDIQIMNNGWEMEVYPDLDRGKQDYSTQIWSSSEGPQIIPVEDYVGSKDVSDTLRDIHTMSPTEKQRYKKMYQYLRQQPNLDSEQTQVLQKLDQIFGGKRGSEKTAWDQPRNLKYRQLITQESVELEEDATEVTSDDGQYYFYRSPNNFPFALLRGNNEVYVGDEGQGHGSSEINLNGRETTLRDGDFYKHGRLFGEPKVIAFWDLPIKNELKDIVQQLTQKTKFNLLDGEWKIKKGYDYIPITDYLGMDVELGGQKRTPLERIKEKIHTMTPAQKESYKKIYQYLKQHEAKLGHDQKEVLKLLHSVFGVTGGSTMTASDQPQNLKYRQALRQEGEDINESPDTFIDNDHYIYYRDSGTYPFAFNTVTNQVEVGEESGGHSDVEFDVGDGRSLTFRNTKEGEYKKADNPPFEHLGRIFADPKVITFWTIPANNVIKVILDQLTQKTEFDFWDGEWRIEVKNNESNSDDYGKQYTVPIKQYLGMERKPESYSEAELNKIIQEIHMMPPTKRQMYKNMYIKLRQTPKEKLSKDNQQIFDALHSVFGRRGMGSDKYGKERPLQYQQALRQEGVNESPDNMHTEDGKELSYNDSDSRPFGYKNGEMVVGEIRSIHPFLAPFGREEMQFAGRVWTDEKLVSFWEYPAPRHIKRVLNALSRKIDDTIDDSWKIETLPDVAQVKTDDLNSGSGGDRDWSGKRQYTHEPSTKFLTPSEYEQLNSVGQRSKEELAKAHVDSPLNKPKKSSIKGVGSDKYGKKKPLAYRQAIQTSESDINESPDNINMDGERVYFTEGGAYAFALAYNGGVAIGEEGDMHSESIQFYEEGDPDDWDYDEDEGGVPVALDNERYFHYQGRLFSDQKIVTFWDYPTISELKGILQHLQKLTNINFWDGEWKIEVIDGNKEHGDLIPITQYTGSADISDEYKEDHTKSPLLKKKQPSKYGGGSKLTGFDQPQNIKYRQALRQEGLESIIQDEIQLQEDPDGVFDPSGEGVFSWDDDGAYAFGYSPNTEELMVGEQTTHGSLQDSEGNEFEREQLIYPGRIWVYDHMISFWQYPPPSEIKGVLRDLEHALGISILNNSEYNPWVIETLPDTVNRNLGYDDYHFDDSMDWGKSAQEPDFLSPDDYENLNSVGQRSAEELAKAHVESPMVKSKKPVVKGSGSDRYGTKRPLAYRQAIQTSEGEIEESPDEINLDGGDQLSYHTPRAYAFGYKNGFMKVSSPNKTHMDIGERRKDMSMAGRLWSDYKIISFWEYPQPDQIHKVLNDIENVSQLEFDDTWKIETLPDIVGKEEGRGAYSDWNGKVAYGYEPSVQYLSPSQYSKLGSVGQRSSYELEKPHVLTPADKEKYRKVYYYLKQNYDKLDTDQKNVFNDLNKIFGGLYGSSKYGKEKPLPYRQAVQQESDSIFEEVENLLEEFSYEDYFESYDEMAHNILQDFLYNNNEDYTKNIEWTLVPFQLLKSTWDSWVQLNGEVRYPQNVEKIENKLYRNIMKISVITEMCGHKESGEYYMSENNEELNEVGDNFLNWKTSEPINTNQLEMDFQRGGGAGNPTVDTNFTPSEYQMKLYTFLNNVYEEKGLEEYSPQDAKKELLDVLLEKFYWKYAIDPKSGHNYISDYGLKPLENLLVKLVDEEDISEKIPIMDQILNVAHQRSDLAAWLVQGGTSALSQLSGYGELATTENINEKLEGEFPGRWVQNRPIEIYSNPKSIKRMDGNIRGIIDDDGNVYIANVGDSLEKQDRGPYAATTHGEMLKFLKKKGLIRSDNYFEDGVLVNLAIHRVENTNVFGIGESIASTILSKDEWYAQAEEIAEKAKQKNPTMEFEMKNRWDVSNY